MYAATGKARLTGQDLDILGVGLGSVLENDGAATLAAVKLEGEWLARDNLEVGVEELGLNGDGDGGQGR